MEKKIKKHLRPDHQMYDKVVIETNPRFKDSELSGSQWRISASIQFYCKGRVMHQASFNSIETALDFVKAEYHKGADNGRADIPYEDLFCDQEGCERLPKTIYKLKQQYNEEGLPKQHQFIQHRSFCNVHDNRGDQSYNDNMNNYEVVKV